MIEIKKRLDIGGEGSHTIAPPIKTIAAGADPTVGVKMSITPAIATDWLETRGNNRKVLQSTVDRYGLDMRQGRWVFNGAPIQFDEEGKLLNGQHRLWAIVESGCTIEAVVQWGIPRAAQATIDNGQKWQVKDLLYMEDEKNTTLLQAALRWVFRDEIGSLMSSPGMSNSTAIELLERHPGIRRSVDFISSVRGPMYPSAAAFLHYKVSALDPDKADEFFMRLADGVGLQETSPVYRLRERLHYFLGRGRMHQSEALAIAIIAWNAFRAGKEMRLLIWRKAGANAQPFPQIDGLEPVVNKVQRPRNKVKAIGTKGEGLKRKPDRPKKTTAPASESTGGVRREVGDATTSAVYHTGRR